MLEKINTCDNDLTKSFTSKTNKYTACGYSLFTHVHLIIELKTEDSMEKFCADLKKHAIEIISFEKKEMLSLIEKQQKKYVNKNPATYANKNSMKSLINIKISVRSEIIVITQINILGLLIVSGIL